jgi:hypothetical protein
MRPWRRQSDHPAAAALLAAQPAATSVDTLTLCVLGGFTGLEELMLAVRASVTLPRLGGEPPIFRGEPLIDGGLVEPIELCWQPVVYRASGQHDDDAQAGMVRS